MRQFLVYDLKVLISLIFSVKTIYPLTWATVQVK